LSGSVRDRRAWAQKLAAVAIGALLAACGDVSPGERKATPPPDAVAVVNGHLITRAAFEQYLESAAGGDDTASLDPEVRRRLLLQMMDEELLLQRGIALGLQRSDPAARRAILSAVIASVTSEGGADEPDEATLRSFYEENPARFAGPERFAVEVIRVSDHGRADAEVQSEAEEVANHLREGGDVAAVLASHPYSSALATSTPPLPLGAVEQRAGPAAANALSQLSPGEVSDPVRDKAGYTVVALREHRPPEVVPFDDVRGEVRIAYLRQRRVRALRDLLEALHREADIRILDPEFVAP
jgi:parvulin-like peptidyl-prolyl isomerase